MNSLKTSIRHVNPAFEKLAGFSSAEVVGKRAPYPWWPEERVEKRTKDLEMALLKGIKGFEQLLQRENGERFWMESEGRFRYYLSIWIDVTERKRVEEALKASEKRYRDLFNNASDAIFVRDLRGNFIETNQAAAEFPDTHSQTRLVVPKPWTVS